MVKSDVGFVCTCLARDEHTICRFDDPIFIGVCGVGILAVLHCSPCFIFFCTCSISLDLIVTTIRIRACLFLQLEQKTHRKAPGNAASTYDDDYEATGGSTVNSNRTSCSAMLGSLSLSRFNSSSYNGPYLDSADGDLGITSDSNMTPTFSRTSSLKKQHVHWPDRSPSTKIEDFPSIPDRPYPYEKGACADQMILHAAQLTESPSVHRYSTGLSLPSSATLSHVIQTAIIPAGSTASSAGANEFITPSRSFTSTLAGSKSNV